MGSGDDVVTSSSCCGDVTGCGDVVGGDGIGCGELVDCGGLMDSDDSTSCSMGWGNMICCGDCGGEYADFPALRGEESTISGGADVDLRICRGTTLTPDIRLRAECFGGEGFAGEEESAPDWKMLLSSHPLSSPPDFTNGKSKVATLV